MTKPARFAAWALKKLWLLSAILLVVFAVLLSVLRYALPYVEDNKSVLENYVHEQYGVNLTIDNVHAVWQRAGPSIVLTNVQLARNEASPVALNIDEVYIELDFWQSLTQWLISSRQFNLVGLTLEIEQDRLEGSSDNDFPVVDALEDLFLEQLQSFSLSDGELRLLSAKGDKVFDIPSLSWLNKNGRHRGTGSVQVRELATNSASFLIDLKGHKDKLSGVMYAKAEDLDISPWVSEWLHTQRPLSESRANFELWSELKDGALAAGFVRLAESKLVWGGENYAVLKTGIEGGTIQILPKTGQPANDWNIRVDRLVVSSNDQTMVTDLVGQYSYNGDILINTVKPLNISPFSTLVPLLTDSVSQVELDELALKGQLATFQLMLKEHGPSLAAKVLDAGWRKSGNIPGLSELDAELYWYKNQGTIILASDNSDLAIDNILPSARFIEKLRAKAYIYKELRTADWTLNIPHLVFKSDALGLHQQLRLNLDTGELSTEVKIEPRELADIQALFPETLMGEGTTTYLNNAFTGAGSISNATILWHGKPHDYPFSNGEGIFQANVDIQNSDFTFAEKWPALTSLDLSLRFENKRLTMYSKEGQLQGVTVSDLSAVIPELVKDATLSIDATGQGTGEALTSLMVDSALSDSLGAILDKDVQVGGPVKAQLHLAIPLDGKPATASGIASLSGGNSVNVTAVNMQLSKVKGRIAFENGNISSDDLLVTWLEQPMQISLKGQQTDSDYQLTLNAGGQWSVPALLYNQDIALYGSVDGEADWSLALDLTLGEGFTYTAELNADTTPVSSSMPAPFSKTAGVNAPLTVSAEGNAENSVLKARLKEDVAFDGVLNHAPLQFSRAHLALGDSDYVALGNGFSISAVLDLVDVEKWYETVNRLLANKDAASQATQQPESGLFPKPERIFVETDELIVAGQAFKNAKVNARQRNNNWFVDVAAPEANLTANIYDEWLTRGVEVEASLLHLKYDPSGSGSNAGNESSLDASTLPPVYFHCSSCRINEYDLGELTLDAGKADDGMIIRQLRSVSKHGVLSASGKWHSDDNASDSMLTGTLKSSDVGLLLEEYGINSGIKDSEGELDFTLRWPESPLDFSLASVQGDIHWSMTDGYLSELSDKGSRIFSLFSLNSLVRKLSLDFRDVFAKGFFYDDMKGSLEVANGKAVTRDTEIDGAAGEIEIRGYTNLVERELDYQVSFAPNVTGNLPVLVYFLATPPTALAALALDQVLTSAKVISNVKYKVTGTWADPVFEEMGRDSKDVELPARVTPGSARDEEPVPLTEDDVKRLNLEVIDG